MSMSLPYAGEQVVGETVYWTRDEIFINPNEKAIFVLGHEDFSGPVLEKPIIGFLAYVSRR